VKKGEPEMTQQQQHAYTHIWGEGAQEVNRQMVREAAPGIWTVVSVNI
jgi:hypothetical protein